MSFDWPSDDHSSNYLEDRVDAKLSALKLVDDGIAVLAAPRYRDCEINVHAVAHSDVKRAGVAPRAGRRGLPPDRPAKAVNVDCGEHFRARHAASGDNGHSWYFTDPVFIADLAQTLPATASAT